MYVFVGTRGRDVVELIFDHSGRARLIELLMSTSWSHPDDAVLSTDVDKENFGDDMEVVHQLTINLIPEGDEPVWCPRCQEWYPGDAGVSE